MEELKKALARGWKNIILNYKLLVRNKLTRIAIYYIFLLFLIVIFAPIMFSYTENVTQAANTSLKLQAPGLEHFFGTDELGRDIFKRILLGTRISLSVSFFAVFASIIIGTIVGGVSGYFGGWVDQIIMRITDIFLGFPSLLLAIVISAFAGPSLANAAIALVCTGWMMYARIVRGQAITVREKPFVKAAKSIGSNHFFIIRKHIIPNCLAPVIVQASMDIGAMILLLASLSFLGLGAQPPVPEWGLMVSTSRNYFLNAWWYGVFPGLVIFITVLAFNLLGDGLREILDPKTRKN